MDYSPILNSRKRPALLKNLIDSVINNTENLNKIEMWISCDEDDKESLKFYENNNTNINSHFSCNFEFRDRERNLHKRFNDLLPKLKGKYIWILNDDTEIITKNWDTITSKMLGYCYIYNRKIVYGNIKCNSIDKLAGATYSSFPIISRQSANILRYVMSEDLPGLGGDVHLWRIHNELNTIVNLDINVRHILHETVKLVCSPDETAYEMRLNTKNNTSINEWNIDISKDIEKLKEYLK